MAEFPLEPPMSKMLIAAVDLGCSDEMLTIVAMLSEVGVLGDVISNASNVVSKGRLGPGHIITANLESGEFRTNVGGARAVAAANPYAEWLASNEKIDADSYLPESQMPADECMRIQAASRRCRW